MIWGVLVRTFQKKQKPLVRCGAPGSELPDITAASTNEVGVVHAPNQFGVSNRWQCCLTSWACDHTPHLVDLVLVNNMGRRSAQLATY